MENFKSLYLEYCKTYNVEPQEFVKEELKRLALSRDETSRTLNLSSHHLTNKTCMILTKLLAHDQNITSLMLNDCTLTSDGINSICMAMNTNNCIRHLELKGNNIHGEGTEALAKLLRQNSTIKTLSLEWNSLGLMDTYAFSQFCESLGMNKSIKDLDLRNNQITHTSALELCAAIEVNTVLQTLDLRWNSIGLVGGKAILNALKKNKTLVQLQIAGNNIPEEIADSINLKIAHNNDNFKTAKDYSNRTATLTNELETVHFQKEKQINLLLSKIDLQEEAVRKTNRTMSEKMKKLQSVLEDRMSTMNAMTSKLSIAEADLALSEQKCADLAHALEKLKMEKDTDFQLVNAKARREKEELLNDKLKVERELKDMVQRYNQVDEKFKDIERKCQELQLSAYEAKEKLAQGQAEYQIKCVVLDDEARRLKQKQRDEIKELEANKAKEIERVKEDFEQTEKNLRERLNKMEAMKHSLEDEIVRLKSNVANEKLSHEQEMHELRVKSQLEDTNKRREMEDRVKTLQASKDDLISENAKLNSKLVDLQQKISSQSLEIETLKRNNDSLRNQLHEKEIELLQDHDKLKSDYEKRIRAVQKDIDRLDSYKETVHDLEIKIKKLEADNQISLRNAQNENESLRSKLKNLEDVVDRVREEEETRKKKGEDFIKECFKPSVVLSGKK